LKKSILTKGILIAIEGIDGAGKTTVVKKLSELFTRKHYQVSTFKEPTDGKYGQIIRNLAQNGRENTTVLEEMNLFLLDRKENCANNILPALNRNEIVILDRYYFSSVAYQGARGLDKDIILNANEKIAIKPDIVIILDCAVKIGLNRIKYQRGDIPNHFEKEEHLEEARKIFLQMQAPYLQIIDSSKSEEQVFKHVENIVIEIITPFSKEITDQQDLFSVELKQQDIPFFKN
jgi:dTMP kinase